MTAQQLIIEAWHELVRNRARLTQLLFIPIILIFVISPMSLADSEHGISIGFALALINIFLYVVLAIIIHRTLIIGPDSVSRTTFIPNTRTLKFAVYSIAGGLILVPAVLLIFIPVVGIILSYMGMAYIMGRCFLVFPSIAIDGNWSFADSWRATKPHQLAVFLAIGALPLTIGFLQQILIGIHNIEIFIGLISAVSSVFTIAVISVTYSHLADEV